MDFDNEALATGQLMHLPKGLLDHCRRTSQMARELAARFGVDPDRAALGGMLHDVVRAASNAELLEAAERYGIPIDPVERATPVLLHGPVGAVWVREHLGIEDEELLSAIAWHTTGRVGMTPLEKVILLADKLEPGKDDFYAGLDAVRAALDDGLDAALVTYFDLLFARLQGQGFRPHPVAVKARAAALAELARGSSVPTEGRIESTP